MNTVKALALLQAAINFFTLKYDLLTRFNTLFRAIPTRKASVIDVIFVKNRTCNAYTGSAQVSYTGIV